MTNDPYQPPTSDVTSPAQQRRSIGWKIYVIVITLLSVLGFVGTLGAEGSGIAEYITLALWVPATAGLFGFAFVKPVLQPRFWLYFLVVYLIASVGYYFVTQIDLSAGMTENEYLGSQVVGWLLALPAFWALYLYSKPTDLAWRGRGDT